MSIATFAGSIGSFDRIQAFLKTDVRQDTRDRPMDLLSDSGYQGSDALRTSGGSDISTEKVKPKVLLEEKYEPLPSSTAIAIHNGSFGWDKEKEPLLQLIDIIIPKEKLTIMVGPVGCGKSTLLKAILGEVPTMQGTVQMSSLSIAYCDQTPWHTSGTVQRTITAFSDFDEWWYQSVIRACALEDDLRQLPRGDQTMVGSKGIALSGGQSQRLVSVKTQRTMDILL